MTMLENQLHDLSKTCNLVHTITRMDIRLIDRELHAALQLVNHTFPAVLQHPDGDYRTIRDALLSHKPNCCFYYLNSYGLEYIATGIWNNAALIGFVLVGPFLSSIPVAGFISDMIVKNSLPISERKQLQQFYTSLPIISSNDSNSLGDLVINLIAHPHIDSQLVTADIPQPAANKSRQKSDTSASTTIIELRYQYEEKLMNAIARGDKAKLTEIFNEANSIFYIPDRIPESPIRSAKNLLLVLNTLCRVAAKRGGVHPVYLHNISEQFSIRIERAPNLPQIKKLNQVIINEYCDIVKASSTRNYSAIVKAAVDYIEFNLEQPLTLHDIAATIHVNPSHLSRKFKSECGMTIIDFINQKRIEESKLYLQRGSISITEIAYMVGFNDLNYFGRVFKKFTSLTPSQYIREHTKA